MLLHLPGELRGINKEAPGLVLVTYGIHPCEILDPFLFIRYDCHFPYCDQGSWRDDPFIGEDISSGQVIKRIIHSLIVDIHL